MPLSPQLQGKGLKERLFIVEDQDLCHILELFL